VWFQRISISTPRRDIGNLKGEGVSKAKSFKRKYEPQLEFPEGWEGLNQKTHHGRAIVIFWTNALCIMHISQASPRD